MDAQRKKLGRSTKAALVIKETENNEIGGAATLVAISPINDDEEINMKLMETKMVSPINTDSTECRRSSRKKIPKFDVRDLLLNKHRKPHKIQIEARIDNAPSTSTKTIYAANNNSNSNCNIIISPKVQDKCFIEKTSIIQRTLATEGLHSTQVPIPVTTEIFKPNQSSSLIVAQMESSSSGQKQKLQKNLINFIESPLSASTISTKITTINEVETNAPRKRGRPSKVRHSIETEKTVEISPKNETTNSQNDASSSFQAAFEIAIASSNIPKVLKKQISEDSKSSVDSRSSDIPLTQEESISPRKLYVRNHTSTITKPLNETEDKLIEETFENKTEVQQNQRDLPLITVDRSFETIKSISPTPTSKSSTPTLRRYERRSGRRLDDGSNSKTLEETFAEIAAKSSKAILDMAVQKPEKESIGEDCAQNINSPCQTSENIEDFESGEHDPKIVHKEETDNVNVVVPKRRGRKPKPKINQQIEENKDFGNEQVLQSHKSYTFSIIETSSESSSESEKIIKINEQFSETKFDIKECLTENLNHENNFIETGISEKIENTDFVKTEANIEIKKAALDKNQSNITENLAEMEKISTETLQTIMLDEQEVESTNAVHQQHENFGAKESEFNISIENMINAKEVIDAFKSKESNENPQTTPKEQNDLVTTSIVKEEHHSKETTNLTPIDKPKSGNIDHGMPESGDIVKRNIKTDQLLDLSAQEKSEKQEGEPKKLPKMITDIVPNKNIETLEECQPFFGIVEVEIPIKDKETAEKEQIQFVDKQSEKEETFTESKEKEKTNLRFEETMQEKKVSSKTEAPKKSKAEFLDKNILESEESTRKSEKDKGTAEIVVDKVEVSDRKNFKENESFSTSTGSDQIKEVAHEKETSKKSKDKLTNKNDFEDKQELSKKSKKTVLDEKETLKKLNKDVLESKQNATEFESSDQNKSFLEQKEMQKKYKNKISDKLSLEEKEASKKSKHKDTDTNFFEEKEKSDGRAEKSISKKSKDKTSHKKSLEEKDLFKKSDKNFNNDVETLKKFKDKHTDKSVMIDKEISKKSKDKISDKSILEENVTVEHVVKEKESFKSSKDVSDKDLIKKLDKEKVKKPKDKEMDKNISEEYKLEKLKKSSKDKFVDKKLKHHKSNDVDKDLTKPKLSETKQTKEKSTSFQELLQAMQMKPKSKEKSTEQSSLKFETEIQTLHQSKIVTDNPTTIDAVEKERQKLLKKLKKDLNRKDKNLDKSFKNKNKEKHIKSIEKFDFKRLKDKEKQKEKEKQKRKRISNESDTSTASSTPTPAKQIATPISQRKEKSQHSSSHKKFKTSKNLDDSNKEILDSSEKQEKDKDKEKQIRKERQQKLKAALEAALSKDADIKLPNEDTTPREDTTPKEATTSTTSELNLKPMTPVKSTKDQQLISPPTPGTDNETDNSFKQTKDNSTEITEKGNEPDPFYDIAKFIEDGVNLLKRDYKLAEEDEKLKLQKTETTATEETKTEEIPIEGIPIEETDKIIVQEEFQTAAKPVIEVKENSSTTILPETPTTLKLENTLDLYETPADTPISTPAQTTPSSSPIPTDNTDNTENSVDTYYYADGKRRSHRLKKIINAPKALEGRGLAKLHYSIEDHLMDLAEVELKNAKFLKEMEERLSNFEVIKENEYHCDRLVNRETRKMICDCFLTQEEAGRGELGCGEDCLNRLLMIECGTNCKVGERCTNNRFQKFLCAPCRVFRTEKKGFGIMADVEIHANEFIMEYVGEVLDYDLFEKRRIAYSKDKSRHFYFMELRSDAIIDATSKGNISRFINHSCDPNAETQKWTVNGELRIGFFSRRSIMPGEEITFDYQYQRYGREAQRCYCESANCRGWIGEEPNSDEGEQVDDDDDDEDDDDEEEEEEEDEEEVTSLVKGLLSVDDVDEDETENAAIKENKALTAKGSKAPKTNENDDTIESKQKFMAYLGKISAKIEMHKQSKLEEKKLRKRRKRKQQKTAGDVRRSKTAAQSRFLEDPDLEDEIDFLSRCGLKNQSDTLRLSRLMVRAKLSATRLNLLAILREGELPCRRLFLDYHGLHLLHGWMYEVGRTDMTMRMSLLQTLECLPLANKTVLVESKVYQTIRGWCSSENQASAAPSTEAGNSSSSPSDESSKESGEQKTQQQNENSETTSTKTEESENLAAKLLKSWDNLPDVFRIPKRERIEQMKEHEREADRQYAATIEATEEEQKTASSTDRYQNDRFQRRFVKPQKIRNIGLVNAPGSSTSGSAGGSSNYKRSVGADVLSPEDTKNMSKEQRRELFAAKVARDEAQKRLAERRREFETKCQFFGLDPRVTRQEDLPFCVSDSGQWFNERRQPIAKPPAFAHVQTPIKPKSTNPADYYLPKATTNLPQEWTFAITPQGKIYYYHVKHRIPQWEPPTQEQISQTKWSDTETESEGEGEKEDEEEITEERIKEIEAIQSQEELTAFLKKIAKEQRQARYKRLVEERPISPRREEDRIYNQIEMRKYKENKEKIKKRKEEIRRRRSEANKNSTASYMCTLGSLLDAASKTTTTATTTTSETKTADNIKSEPTDLPADALPIQDYLLSSDDDAGENDLDEMKAECNNSPLLEKIVQGDKIVDELDALTTKRQLKRPLPPHRELNFDIINKISASTASTSGNSENSLSSIEKPEHKKRRQDKKEKSKRSRDSNDSKYRKLKEKFRCEIAGVVVQHLKPYRKDSCTFARITSNEDFNHLARKLTHFVMIKELKYCDAVGQTLVVTESVKNKSREFIKKYMAKYDAVYVKPENDPEFKDIPFKL